MSCDRCVPVDSVQHAEVQMAMVSHQLRWFWLCSYWTRAVAAGGEREFTRWFSFTENVWAQAEQQHVLAAKVEAKVLGPRPRAEQGETNDEHMWLKAAEVLECLDCGDHFT